MNWAEFARLEPELAVWGAERFERTGLVFVGTLRKDGWPRISPVEPMFVGEQLYLGMMWRSVKALDLLRDPRCTIHNAVSDREGGDGEFKLYGGPSRLRTWPSGGASAMPSNPRSDGRPKKSSSTALPSTLKAPPPPNCEMDSFTAKCGSTLVKYHVRPLQTKKPLCPPRPLR